MEPKPNITDLTQVLLEKAPAAMESPSVSAFIKALPFAEKYVSAYEEYSLFENQMNSSSLSQNIPVGDAERERSRLIQNLITEHKNFLAGIKDIESFTMESFMRYLPVLGQEGLKMKEGLMSAQPITNFLTNRSKVD